MSSRLGQLCSLLLTEYFGDTVEKVGIDLFRGGQRPLRLICDSTKLHLNEVREALCILIKYRLVTFHPSRIKGEAEYRLHHEKIILLLRYPKDYILHYLIFYNEKISVQEITESVKDLLDFLTKISLMVYVRLRYLMQMKSLYGNEAEIIVEEILRHGSDVALCILFRSYKRIVPEGSNINDAEVQKVRNMFEMLVNKQYIKRSSKLVEKKAVPELLSDDFEQFSLSKIDIPQLYEALKQNSQPSCLGDTVFWEINFDRFHQDMRNDLLVLATARRTNPTGGEIMRHILQQMNVMSNPWAPVSNPILMSELKDQCKRSGADSNLLKNLDDYLAIMTTDFGGFLKKSQMMTGAYEVHLKHAVIELTWCVLASGVDAKYGSNAARIFRLIREQEFIEQDEIQKKAMLPDKEAKFLTYSLLQSGWIQQHELKKGLQKAGPVKTFYLFYIDFDQVVRMYIETCYKSLYSAITLREQEKMDNKCLLEKKQRIDAIVLHMRKEGATDEQVAEIEEMVTPPEHALLEKIHLNVNKVYQAELQIDETLFILQLCVNLKDA